MNQTTTLKMEQKFKKTPAGEIPMDWGAGMVGEIAHINATILGESTPPDKRIRYIDISSIEKTGTISSVKELIFKEAPSRARRVTHRGDILVSTVRPYLRAFARIKEDSDSLVASTGFSVLSPSDQVDGEFLYQYVLGDPFVTFLRERMTGSNYPAVNAGDVALCPLPLPPLSEQRRIAEILSAVDDNIEKTNVHIERIQHSRDALLQQLLTHGIDRMGRLRGANSENPGRYKNTPLGALPKEWLVVPLSELVEGLDAGVSVNSEDRPSDNAEKGVLKTGALASGRFQPEENKVVLAQEINRLKTPVESNSILVSRMNTPDLVGESAYVEQPHPNLFLPDRIWQLRFRDKRSLSVRWLSYVFISKQAREYIHQNATGTSGSMKNLPKQRLMQMPIGLPDLKEQRDISKILSSFDATIEQLELIASKEKQLKNGLMQVLLTGKVRVGKC